MGFDEEPLTGHEECAREIETLSQDLRDWRRQSRENHRKLMSQETLRRVQAEAVPWVKHNFGDRPSWQPLLGAQEELGELAHAHLKEIQGIRTDEDHEAKAKDAVADIIIFLCDYASARGWDITDILGDTWEQVKQRDWKKNPSNADEEN